MIQGISESTDSRKINSRSFENLLGVNQMAGFWGKHQKSELKLTSRLHSNRVDCVNSTGNLRAVS